MKVFTVASYYGSGSSAVTDLLSEFENVRSLTNYEFRFAHDPDGLSELEYNLVENFNRHNSGHALKRYKDIVDYFGDHFLVRRYEPFFDGQWKKLSYEYIDSLTDFTYPGVWQYDYYDRGKSFEFWAKLPDRILKRTIWRNNPDKHCTIIKGMTLASHPTEDRFLECTRKYTTALMKAANPENKPYMVVDQILPSSNIERHMRYFENVYAFVVDRDPRDVFLLDKYVWKDGMVPQDPETFCKWYRYTRSTRGVEHWNPEHIMFVQFEDLIYKYEETSKRIIQWTGMPLEWHIAPKTKLIPENSLKNTRYWEQHPETAEEAEYIAKELPEFLYHIG